MTKSKVLVTLLAINAALAGALAWRGVASNTAQAQVGRNEPGKYLLIPGRSQIGASIIYIVDTANRRVGGLAPSARDTLEPLTPLPLDPIFDAAAAGQAPTAVNPDQPRSNNPTRGRTPTPNGR